MRPEILNPQETICCSIDCCPAGSSPTAFGSLNVPMIRRPPGITARSSSRQIKAACLFRGTYSKCVRTKSYERDGSQSIALPRNKRSAHCGNRFRANSSNSAEKSNPYRSMRYSLAETHPTRHSSKNPLAHPISKKAPSRLTASAIRLRAWVQ